MVCKLYYSKFCKSLPFNRRSGNSLMMIPEEIETSTSNEGFSMEYNFNERELKLLAKFFSRERLLPDWKILPERLS